MGKVILTYTGGKKESFKCKSEERAYEIAKKRPNVVQWFYYDKTKGQKAPIDKPKKEYIPNSFEEFERMMKTKGFL